MSGGGSQTQRAEIPKELKPLFDLLAKGNIENVPLSAGLVASLLQGQGAPRLTPTQKGVGELLAQKARQNPLLAQLPASAQFAQGIPLGNILDERRKGLTPDAAVLAALLAEKEDKEKDKPPLTPGEGEVNGEGGGEEADDGTEEGSDGGSTGGDATPGDDPGDTDVESP